MTVNIGLIGYGYWGRHLARNFYQYNGTKLVMCSDLLNDRLKEVNEFYPTVKTTNNYRDILNDPNISGVIIATPVEGHYAIAKEALDAGKHVLVEKPLTSNAKEAEELVKLAKERGKTLMVDHTFLYLAETEKIKELIKSGEMGDLYTLEMQRVSLGLFQRTVNVIQDLATHDIAILNYLLGTKPTAVHTTAAYACVGKGKGMEDTAHIVFTYPNANIVTLYVSWVHPHKKRLLTIVGSQKMVVCDYESKTPISIYNKGAYNYMPFQPSESQAQHDLVHYRDSEIIIPPIKGEEALRSVAKEFAACINENRRPKTSGEDGLNVVKILDATLQSMREGRKVEIKY